MSLKNQRLGRKMFAEVFKTGKRFSSPYFLMVVGSSPDSSFRLVAVVGKKVSRSAVVRNKTKRRIYGAVRALHAGIKGCAVIIIAKKGAETAFYKNISPEISKLFKDVERVCR
jgi:ribonuclease P protein component